MMRMSSATLDQWRARALRGDRLGDLSDTQREWVWRSILKGVRRAEAVRLAQLTADQEVQAVARVRCWYAQRLAEFKAQPRIVRPVVVSPHRRGWWPFGKRG
jgi:hypothetical protein